MKLAEALNQRADLQKRIAQLRERISNNVKVQEGDEPAEDPEDLFRELAVCLNDLENIIVRINRTNQETVWEGKTLTEMIAGKDVLSLHLSVLRSALDAANVRSDRYSRNEIIQRGDTLQERFRLLKGDTALLLLPGGADLHQHRHPPSGGGCPVVDLHSQRL